MEETKDFHLQAWEVSQSFSLLATFNNRSSQFRTYQKLELPDFGEEFCPGKVGEKWASVITQGEISAFIQIEALMNRCVPLAATYGSEILSL